MGNTGIDYVMKAWNPCTGCDPISPGCAHCWARAVHKRMGLDFSVRLHPERLDDPLKWRKAQTVAVCFMGDIGHPQVPYAFLDRIWETMRQARQHTFLVLTKRPEYLRVYLRPSWEPLPNVWLGVSVEDQRTADERIPLLLETPAAHRWVSYEPALGPVILNRWLPLYNPKRVPPHTLGMLDGVVIGGESGPHARPCDPAWVRSLVEQCRAAHVSVYVKQGSGRYPGRQYELPADLFGIREVPW